MTTHQPGDCLLCTAPLPVDQQVANRAFLAGMVSSAAHTILGAQLPPLCEAHRGELVKLLETCELRLQPHEDHFHIAGQGEPVEFKETKH